MSPRIIQLPLSGRDRRHYVQQLKIAEQEHRSLATRTAAAYHAAELQLQLAHRLSCEEWSARQFIGGDAAPSPTIAVAILGGCDLLDVQCTRCGRAETVDLTQLIWPRDNAIHTLERVLRCQRCKRESRPKARTNLLGLRMRTPPDPETPRAALRRRRASG